MNPDVCDVRVSWILAGCRDRWRGEVPGLSINAGFAAMAGRIARALVFEQLAAEDYRKKRAFNGQ